MVGAELLSFNVAERVTLQDGRTYLRVEDPGAEIPLGELGRGLRTHPLLAGLTTIEDGPAVWPEHWRLSSGLATEDLTAHGATHTVAEVLTSDPQEPLEAIIQGMVKGLGGAEGWYAVVDDGTGSIGVHCPPHSTMLGPVISTHFEFEIGLPAGRRIPADTAATSEVPVEDLSEEQRVDRFTARHFGPVGAVARMVRPIE